MNSPDQTWHLPAEHIGRHVLVFESLPSTNDFAAEHWASLEPGTVIMAREQTAGRGSYGRSWLSPAGAGVWMSIVLRPTAELLRPVVAIAWVGVSVAKTIRRFVKPSPVLRWPNDILIQSRKIAGILIEQRRAMIAGIGLNVNQSATQLLADGLGDATSMAIVAGQSLDVDAIARDLIVQLDKEYGSLVAGEMTTLESDWNRQMGLLGRHVVIERHDGQCLRGRLSAMTFAGIQLETPSGMEHLEPELVKHVTETHHPPHDSLVDE